LGSLSQTARQIQTMKEGDVLYFKKPEHARVVIRDMPVFDVEVGNLGSQLAIKIVNSIQLPDVGTKQG
jgi:flagellar motor switch protein FliM